MYLQIPVKLENYINEIKRKAAQIDEGNCFSLLRVGSSNSEQSQKLVYIIYNPFVRSFSVDPNFFTKSSKIFKMYPSQFELKSNSAAAFVVFVENTHEIFINEQKIISEMKQKINSNLRDLNEKSTKVENILNIELNDVDFSNTMYLNPESVIDIVDENVVDYVTRYQEDIEITLNQITSLDGRVCLDIQFFNKNSDVDIRIHKYRLKLFDLEKKLYVNVVNDFIIKRNSHKISKVYLNKIEFNQIDTANLQLKVTLI